MEAAIDDILDFWFGDLADGFPATDRSALWWGANRDTDDLVMQRFGDALAAEEAGRHVAWHENARGRLASILLLDQFTRMLSRGKPEAFANDLRALELAEEGVGLGLDAALPVGTRQFFYMPFMHAEDLARQERGVDLFTKLVEATPELRRADSEANLRFAREHHEVIRRFGRFPHRNRVLGRASTPEEQAYLEGGGATWGQ